MFKDYDNSNPRKGAHGKLNRPDWPNRRRAGFTLVELLVVISIIGILVGLTMPAVMSAIESSRRSKCANNLRQVAMATTQYETQQGQYPLNGGLIPSGYTQGTPSQYVGLNVTVPSWMTSLLPYLDSGPLYSQVAFSNQTASYALSYVNTASGYNNLAVLETPISTFLCPSDNQMGHIGNQLLASGTSMSYATTNYKACAGSNWSATYNNGVMNTSASNTWTLGRFCLPNPNAADGVDHGNGVICRGALLSTDSPIITSIKDIRDGAGKTFFAGEAVPAWSGWSLWFWFDGSTATCGIPMNFCLNGKTPESESDNWLVSYGFASRHKQGCNFAMCDGSVPFVSQQIDLAVYWALATIDGGEASVLSQANGVTIPVQVPGY